VMSICHEGVTKHHFSIYLPLSDRFNSLITKYYFVSVNLQSTIEWMSDYFKNEFWGRDVVLCV
ncbi:hypothetical protein, partial [Flectobacillus longus]|uniref:hypothetical protein n=1 Tax=Flectobacillus longus TaxID=2984207 RepID=UPI0024B82F3A